MNISLLFEATNVPEVFSSTSSSPPSPPPHNFIQEVNWTTFNILRLTLQLIITLLTIAGNSFLLIIVLTNKKLRSNPLNLFVLNLCIADLLVGLLIQPITMLTWSAGNRWYFGANFCVMWQMWVFWFCSASALSLCTISIDRYIGVTRPLHYSSIMTRRRALWLIAAVWIFSLVLNTISLLVWPVEQLDPNSTCVVVTRLENALITSIGVFFLPALFVIFAYGKIYCVVRAKMAVEMDVCHNATIKDGLRIHRGGCGTVRTENKNKIESIKFHKHSKAAKTLSIIVGAYLTCWGPVFITLLLINFNVEFKSRDTLLDVFIFIGMSNSCLNPLIYVGSSAQLKGVIKDMAKKNCLRKK